MKDRFQVAIAKLALARYSTRTSDNRDSFTALKQITNHLDPKIMSDDTHLSPSHVGSIETHCFMSNLPVRSTTFASLLIAPTSHDPA